jgi:hypothetical protein
MGTNTASRISAGFPASILAGAILACASPACSQEPSPLAGPVRLSGDSSTSVVIAIRGPREIVYHLGKSCPISLELRNDSATSVAFSDLGKYASPVLQQEDGKYLAQLSPITISPWAGRKGGLSAGEKVTWTEYLDRCPFNPPPTSGTRYRVRYGVFLLKERRPISSDPVVVVTPSEPTARIASPDEVPARWSDAFDLIYEEGAGLWCHLTLHIAHDGHARIESSGGVVPAGVIEGALPPARLDALAALIRSEHVCEAPFGRLDVAPPDGGEYRFALTIGEKSMIGIYNFLTMKEVAPQLVALQKELRGIMKDLWPETAAALKP